MIKFTALIHKKTGKVIKYEDWLTHRDFQVFKFGKHWNIKDMIFSDDFEIIYDSEFTTKELFELNNVNLNEDLRYKLGKLRIDRKKLKDKYGIEV